MLKLSAFADEISPELDEQVRVCRENAVTHFELRSVSKVNVLDLDDALRERIRTALRSHGMGVVSIGSPIGKVAIDRPWGEHFERFKIAVDAREFGLRSRKSLMNLPASISLSRSMPVSMPMPCSM